MSFFFDLYPSTWRGSTDTMTSRRKRQWKRQWKRGWISMVEVCQMYKMCREEVFVLRDLVVFSV